MVFNEEEKALAYKISKEIITLSEIARREGLLALDECISNLPDRIEGKFGNYMKIMMTYVIDGNDENCVAEIGENMIVYSELEECEEIIFEMILDGVLSIQRGDNPYIIACRLASYFGIEGYMEAVKAIKE